MSEKKTLSLIGDKEIKVKIFNKTYIRITILLSILGNGKSLPLFVVFMGKPKGIKEKNLEHILKWYLDIYMYLAKRKTGLMKIL